MKDNRQIAEELISRYNQGTATPQERMLVEQWFLLDLEKNTTVPSTERINVADERISANLAEYIDNTPGAKTIRLWPRIAAVAAAVALIVLGVYFFNAPSRHLEDTRDLLTSANDIAPGKNGATITLDNGKVINLSDAKSGVVIGEDLKYSDGEILRDALDDKGAKDMTASTTKGQTYLFTLPDGTKVWLNAASSLTIPSDFSGIETRKVELTGEAYFEVAKNKKRPFIVKSLGQEVTVLGTHFNISAYKDEGSIKTTLLEGSVRVATSPPYEGGVPAGGGGRIGKTTPASPPLLAKEGTILKPGQQSVVSGSNRITVKEADTEEVLAWQKGYFMFNNESLDRIMKRVARWYNVEVIYENDEMKSVTYYGTVSRFEKISKVLSKLQATSNVKFRIEDNKIYVFK